MGKVKIKFTAQFVFTCLIVLLLAVSILFLPACSKEDPSPEKTSGEEAIYPEAIVERRGGESRINLTGRALTETIDALFFRISGELLFIAGEGDLVLEGEKIAELDDKIILDELDGLQASIEDAEDLLEHELLKHYYAYENIRIEIERAEYNYYHGSDGKKLDQLAYEQQLLLLEEQKAQADFDLNQKEDELNDLQEEYDGISGLLNELEITAPYDSLVVSVFSSVGRPVNINQEIIEIIDFNSIIIRADLPEVDRNRIEEDMEATIYFDAYPDINVLGNISRIGQIPVITNAGTFYEIFIGFIDLQDIKIENVYGLNAEIEIMDSNGESVLVVPIDYVYNEGDKSYVNKITGDGKLEKTYIETGSSDLNYIEILSGLNEGDRIAAAR